MAKGVVFIRSTTCPKCEKPVLHITYHDRAKITHARAADTKKCRAARI